MKLKKASNTTLLNPVSLDFGHNYFTTVTINMCIVYTIQCIHVSEV